MNNGSKQKGNRDPAKIVVQGEAMKNIQNIVQELNYQYTNISDAIRRELQEVTEKSLGLNDTDDTRDKKKIKTEPH